MKTVSPQMKPELRMIQTAVSKFSKSKCASYYHMQDHREKTMFDWVGTQLCILTVVISVWSACLQKMELGVYLFGVH